MILDQDLELQLKKIESDINLKPEKANLGILEITAKNKNAANGGATQRTDKKNLKPKKDKSGGVSSTTKSLNTANFSGTSISKIKKFCNVKLKLAMRKTLLINQQQISSKDTGKTTKTGKPNKGKFLDF
jgi:hypothetical protein